MGELIFGNCVRLVDVVIGREIIEVNIFGEFWVVFLILMCGYWCNLEVIVLVVLIDKSGIWWFWIGDIVMVDKYGFGVLFYMVDCVKEFIKVKGF